MMRIVLATLLATSTVVAPAFAAKKKHAAPAVHSTGKTCKGEFMYMKGGKCMDARQKA